MATGIRARLSASWKKHPVITAAFVFMSVLTFALILRLVASIAYWSTHRNLPVEGWMPLGYVSRSHDIPVEKLRSIADLPPDMRDRRPISEIAKSQGKTTSEFIIHIEEGIAGLKADRSNGENR